MHRRRCKNHAQDEREKSGLIFEERVAAAAESAAAAGMGSEDSASDQI